jgi:hypothetical protein
MAPPVRVLALDLENTLISNAVEVLARPGLADFLAWAISRFERVVLFTGVHEAHALSIIADLVSVGDAPREALDIPYVRWSGPTKNLSFVEDAEIEEIILVDDQERFVVPDQRHRWIRIAEWDPPYPMTDAELARVRLAIEAMI